MYPYDFKPKSSGINHRLIFVVMPFDEDLDPIHNDLIVPATTLLNEKLSIDDEELQYYAYRTKDDLRTTSGWENVMEHLFTAQVVIGVLTCDNANVFYELGIAHAIEPISRQVLIAEKGYDPRFDTKDLIYYEYEPNDLTACVDPLSIRLLNALETYKIEQEKVVRQARMKNGPNDFEVIMTHGRKRNFVIPSNDSKGIDNYEKKFGKGAHARHTMGITNLCSHGILGLNTASSPIEGGVNVAFSYWWTSLGNDVLHLMEIINEEELKRRRGQLPDFFEK